MRHGNYIGTYLSLSWEELTEAISLAYCDLESLAHKVKEETQQRRRGAVVLLKSVPSESDETLTSTTRELTAVNPGCLMRSRQSFWYRLLLR